jgi:beta-galactosidase
MKRRSFIQLLAASSAGLTLPSFLANRVLGSPATLPAGSIDLAAEGWRLWPDQEVKWRDEELFLPPDDTNFDKIPTYPPTGGWGALTDTQGISVTLPSSVEEHYWSVLQGDIYKGFFQGVSWWWRTFTAPPLRPGQRMIIRFRAARLRAEVYCNQKLCGYNLIGETPFQADVTDLIQSDSPNQLAVRVTNLGGDTSWIDFNQNGWGKYMIPQGKAIGGLDAGIILEVRDPVSIDELAVLNRVNPREVSIVSTVKNTGDAAYNGPISLALSGSGGLVWQGTQNISVPAGASADFTQLASVPSAELWNLDHPVLYTAAASIPGMDASARSVKFGFRWFAPEGIGSNALLRLNGKRIVLRSAISWGWWAPNGLFPSEELAEKEVQAAKALGLNCLQFHRNIGHPIVLDQHDQLGVLRYEEAGNGMCALAMGNDANHPITPPTPQDITGAGGEPVEFPHRYEVHKILRMVRRDRSHPSLVIYCIQNEITPALNNPHIFWLFERIREIDPSRTVYLHSGGNGPFNQVAMLPYTPVGSFYTEDGTGHSGWRDEHTVGGPGNYRDELYIDKDHFSHRIDNVKEMVIWGEMLGCGMPDDHDKIVNEYHNAPEGSQKGYDLQVHEEVLAAYNEFLDKWKFRGAFPTASALFQAIGTKSYFFWQKIMEGARMCDANDVLVISGWESTHIENHSGLVDQHRNFRTDPAILKKAMEPEVLVVRPKRFVLQPGETANVDVHLINETGRTGPQTLTLSALNADGSSLFNEKRSVQVTGGDVYGEMLSIGFQFTAKTPGTVTISGTLEPDGNVGSKLLNDVEILVVDPKAGAPILSRIAVCEGDGHIAKALGDVFGMTPLDESHLGDPLDVIVLATGSPWKSSESGAGDKLDQSPFPELYKHQLHGGVGRIGVWSGFAPGPLTIEFHFAEIVCDKAGDRLFDLAVNGTSVISNLDIFQESGGKELPLVKTINVQSTDGSVTLTVPQVAKGEAMIAGMKITDANQKTVAVAFQHEGRRDKDGLLWERLDSTTGAVTVDQWQHILSRVRDEGIRLVVLPNAVSELMVYVRQLADANILKVLDHVNKEYNPKDDHHYYDDNGYLDTGRESWMGSWYFARPHWLFDGLPTGSVLGWQYQMSQYRNGSGALLIDAVPDHPIDVAVGYGRDHEAAVGIGTCVIQCGKGIIVLPSLPGMRSSLVDPNSEMTQPVALRLLGNALRAVPSTV